MSLPIPSERPKITREEAEKILRANGDTEFEKGVMLLSIRGYYSKMGRPGNDVGAWDDASVVIGPGVFETFHFNTDPSREGWNPGVGKPYAQLVPGKWYFRLGKHKGVTDALRQLTDEEAAEYGLEKATGSDGSMTVLRTYGPGDKRNYKETGYYAINDHPGGENTTSSWACQTTPPSEYWERYNLIKGEMKKHGQKWIATRLVEA